MPGWEQFAMQTAGQGVNALLGLALQGQADRRQIEQQRKLQHLQIQGSKHLTDYNFQKQLEMWNATNYPAQMAMLRKAGLNPALMYDGAGQGGSTNVATGNVASASAPVGGAEIQTMMAMGLTRELQRAQIENIKAQTDKTKAETGAVAPGIEKTQAETGNIKIDTELKKLEQAFQESTFKNRESLINLTLSKLIEETRIIENNREISDATKQQQIKQVFEQVKNLAADTLQKQAQTAKTRKEYEEIEQRIKNLQQQWDINSLDQQMAKDGMNPNAGSLNKLFHQLLRGLGSLLGM